MASVIKKRLKGELKKSLPVKAALHPCTRQKLPATHEISITGNVNVQGDVFIDNRKSVKIPDSTLKEVLNKIKPVAD